MLNKKERKFIEENIEKMSLEEIAKELGVRLKKLKREISAMGLVPAGQVPQEIPPPSCFKNASIRSGNRKKIIGLAFLVFIVTFAVYFNTIGNDFIWDDEYLILHNSQIKSFSHFLHSFTTYIGYGSENINNFYRPVQELSDMMDYFLWGTDPVGFHLTNVLLHCTVALLVFVFIFYLCDNPAIAAIAGLLFGVHPVHTEAVAYIAGRADSLYSIFFLSAFIFFVRYVNHMVRKGAKQGLLYTALICFVIALLSKEISMILPLLLALYLYGIIRGTVRQDMFGRIKNLWVPFAVIVGIYGILRSTVLDFSSIAPPLKLLAIPFFDRIFTFFKVVMVYFQLLILPVGLHMERTIPVVRNIFSPLPLVSFFVIAAILWGAALLYKRNRIVSVFVFWFFINLLPVSNIYPINSFIAEHWLYMASIGYFFIIAYYLYHLYIKSRNNILAKSSVIILLASLLALYSCLTIKRNRDWKDEITFFENTLYYSPQNTRLYLNLGNTYYEKGQLDKAIEQYEKAISIRENYPVAYGNIGAIYISKGDFNRAKEYLDKAVELKYNYPIAHYNLGLVYFQAGRMDEALKEMEISLGQLPQHYPSLNIIGRIYIKKGNKIKALEMFNESLRIMPNQDNIRGIISKIAP